VIAGIDGRNVRGGGPAVADDPDVVFFHRLIGVRG
jgi:hypothetical protein